MKYTIVPHLSGPTIKAVLAVFLQIKLREIQLSKK